MLGMWGYWMLSHAGDFEGKPRRSKSRLTYLSNISQGCELSFLMALGFNKLSRRGEISGSVAGFSSCLSCFYVRPTRSCGVLFFCGGITYCSQSYLKRNEGTYSNKTFTYKKIHFITCDLNLEFWTL